MHASVWRPDAWENWCMCQFGAPMPGTTGECVQLGALMSGTTGACVQLGALMSGTTGSTFLVTFFLYFPACQWGSAWNTGAGLG